MKKNKTALQLIAFTLLTISFIACETDFATLESDVINSDIATSFDILSDKFDVISYTKALGPVQTNGIELNALGIYDDTYGRTTAHFVSQLTTNNFNPTFGDGVVIDSVVLTIPYFSVGTGFNEDGSTIYELDSVLPKGETYKPINLRVFENSFFIRDFDPSADFGDSQDYFSNKSASATEMISEAALESLELNFVDYDNNGDMIPANNVININNKGYVLTDVNDVDDDGLNKVLFRQAPGIRVKLDPAFWQNKIIDKQGDAVLSSQNNFADYFRGLYFKAEDINNDGSLLLLNTGSQSSNVTIYYTRVLPTETVGDPEERVRETFVLRLGPNKINFLDNNFSQPINNGDAEIGDSRIYLKGGEGSIAGIKLFDGFYDEIAGITNFEKFRNDFVNLENDKFVSSKRLINEANLVFYVDRDFLDANNQSSKKEPNRLYLYDMANKTPLLDYILDVTNRSLPSLSKFNHLGPLQRVDDESNGKGVKYKLKITEHINNLLLLDSTNVELGLAVSLNINMEDTNLSATQKNVQSSNNLDLTVPISSVISPKGTVLHGNKTEDENKRVYLEIYYTEPNN